MCPNYNFELIKAQQYLDKREHGNFSRIICHPSFNLDSIIDTHEHKPTLLLLATINNDIYAVKSLLYYGANGNCRSVMGLTPVIIASDKNYYNILEELLERGCNPNIQDTTGNTALHYAVISKSIDCIKLLVKSNADTLISNHQGETPEQLARRSGYHGIIPLLQLPSANPASPSLSATTSIANIFASDVIKVGMISSDNDYSDYSYNSSIVSNCDYHISMYDKNTNIWRSVLVPKDKKFIIQMPASDKKIDHHIIQKPSNSMIIKFPPDITVFNIQTLTHNPVSNIYRVPYI